MSLIGIVGSGNVGANTAFFLAERDVADVVLYDIQDGLSEGKALDMMEAASVRGYRKHVAGSNKLADALDSEVCIIAAGSVRKPGMKREELYSVNRDIVADLAERMSGYNGIVIVVTEPVDYLTTLFLDSSKLDPARVIGLGGHLDATRLRYLIAKELGVSAQNVSAVVVGSHTDRMIPLAAYCKVSGIPVSSLMDASRLTEIFDDTRSAADEIVDLAVRTNAYYGPAAAASDLCEAVVRDSRQIVSASVRFSGQYGVDGIAMSLPIVLGEKGVIRVLEPKLEADQRKILEKSAERIRSVVTA